MIDKYETPWAESFLAVLKYYNDNKRWLQVIILLGISNNLNDEWNKLLYNYTYNKLYKFVRNLI